MVLNVLLDDYARKITNQFNIRKYVFEVRIKIVPANGSAMADPASIRVPKAFRDL
jgi:hypothetical protein